MILDFATWKPGPTWKLNTGVNYRRGAVLHSSEGKLSGAFSQLFGTAEVSWHFTIDTDGTIYQHYDTSLQCWHAHAPGNVAYFGIEFPNLYTDGAPDHRPLTQAQVNSALLVLKAVFGDWGLVASRDIYKTLWEHHEVPENPTQCPSGRIPWDAILAGMNPPRDIVDGIGVRLKYAGDIGNVYTPPPDDEIVGIGVHYSPSGNTGDLTPCLTTL